MSEGIINNLETIYFELPEGEWEFKPAYVDYKGDVYLIISKEGRVVGSVEEESVAEFMCVVKNSFAELQLDMRRQQDTLTKLKEENGRLRLGFNILRSELDGVSPTISERLIGWFRRRFGHEKA